MSGSANHGLNERELLALGMSRATVATLREIQQTVGGAEFTMPDIERLLNAVLGDARSATQQLRAENAILRELVFSVVQDVRGAVGRVVDRAAELEQIAADVARCRSLITRMQQELADVAANPAAQRADDTIARRLTVLEHLVHGVPRQDDAVTRRLADLENLVYGAP